MQEAIGEGLVRDREIVRVSPSYGKKFESLFTIAFHHLFTSASYILVFIFFIYLFRFMRIWCWYGEK